MPLPDRSVAAFAVWSVWVSLAFIGHLPPAALGLKEDPCSCGSTIHGGWSYKVLVTLRAREFPFYKS